MQKQVHKDANKYISLNNQYIDYNVTPNAKVQQLNLVNNKQQINASTTQEVDKDRYSPLTVKQFITSKIFKYK